MSLGWVTFTMSKKKPLVQNGLLWTAGLETAVSNAVPLNTPHWQTWLTSNKQFKFKGAAGHFSARRETRRGADYWYAYRRVNGKLNKAYLGKPEELTQTQLEQVAAKLAGELNLAQLSLAAELLDSPPQTSLTGFLRSAKTRPPVLPNNLVSRPRLLSQITSSITLITAPAGFGKSTLLNNWRQSVEMQVAWATLDAEDDHLLHFWSTVVSALDQVRPGMAQKLLPYLHISSAISAAEIVARLNNELACAPNDACYIGLILDDYHHIQNEAVHGSIQRWIEHLPSDLHLVIAGRTRPPLALGRLRALGWVTESEADDLRFTLEEGPDFLQQHIEERPLAYNDMEALVKRTGGWAAGLTLAVLALNKQPDRRRFIDTFNGSHLFLREYFMETALQQQATAIKTFMLQTSILKQLTGDLCNAVTGQIDGEQMLHHLWQQNLFIIRSEEQAWYRYHDLFAEMLTNQLHTQHPDLVPDLHRRAAAWYREHHASADAVRHLLAIEDWEEAASLIEDVGLRELIESGEDSRLLRWLQQLPESVVQRHKTLLFVYLRLAHLALSPAEVRRFLQRIERNLEGKPDEEMTEDEQEVLHEIRNIQRRNAANDAAVLPINAGDPRWDLLDALWITETDYMLKTETVGKKMTAIFDQARMQGNLFVILIAGMDCANRFILKGQLRQGEKTIHQALNQVMAQRGSLPEPASIGLFLLSRIFLARNELEESCRLLQQAATVDPNPTSSNMLMNIALARAQLQSAQGDHKAARNTIQTARVLHAQRPSRSWRDHDLAAYEAGFCVRQKNWGDAQRLLAEAATGEEHPLSQIVQAEMFLYQDQPAEAEARLNEFLTKYPNGYPNESSLGARVLLALALFKGHKLYQAWQVLAESIRLAASENFIRPFLDHGTQLVPLLALLQRKTLAADSLDFIQTILHTLGYRGNLKELIPKEEMELLTTAASITEREQEVLQLVGDGLSSREIGLQLCISPGTVKTHVANIYHKLNVNNRVQAVAKAQSLQLI